MCICESVCNCAEENSCTVNKKSLTIENIKSYMVEGREENVNIFKIYYKVFKTLLLNYNSHAILSLLLT